MQNKKLKIKNKKHKSKLKDLLNLLSLISLFFPFVANALTISPPLKEFLVDPGTTVNGQVLIKNDEKQNLQITLTTQNFEAGGEKGEPRFIDLAGDLASWISFGQKEFVLAPRRAKEIRYGISIPVDAPPGGHFSGILINAKSAEDAISESGAQVENQLASLILLKVSGNVVEEGKLKEFFVIRQPPTGGVDRNDNRERAEFSIRFENLGNVFLKPYGTIRIKNWFGKQIAELGVNDLGSNVLPKSGRRFDVTWEDNDARSGVRKIFFGKYTADLEVFYGAENKKEIASLQFWLMNREGVIAASAIVLITVLVVWRIIQRMRKRRFFVERI